MSKLSHSNEDTMAEIEQRALFSADESGYRMSENEAYQTLHDAGVDEIKWSDSRNTEYMHWIYIHIK